MKILTFDSKFIAAVDPATPSIAAQGSILPLDTAWGPLPTDAHAVGYLPAVGTSFPRLSKAAQDWGHSQGARLHWLMFDLDNPGHAAWDSSELAQAALLGTLDILPLTIRDCAGGYTTRAGLRICIHLDQPVELHHGDALLKYIGDELLAGVGIEVDPSCYQSSRLFRLPRVLRDGVAMASYVEVPDSFRGDIHKALGIEPSEIVVAAAVEADMPTSPADIPDYIWARNIRFPEVTRGDALSPSDDPDGGGSIFRAARAAMAHLAHQANITDPAILISCMWRSLQASGRDPEDLWGVACWIAAQQELKTRVVSEAPEWPSSPPDASTLPTPSESWVKAVGVALAAQQKDYLTQGFRLLRKGYPVKVARVGAFALLTKVIREVLGATSLAEDPRVTYAFVLPSFRADTQVCIETEADVWELCVDAAVISWTAKLGKLEATDAAREVSELRDSWPLLLTTGHHYFALDARCGHGQYTYRNVASEQAVVSMRLMQRDLPIDLEAVTVGPKGGLLAAPNVLDKVGGLVDNVTYRSNLRSARFTNGRRDLELPCHQLADVEPERNTQVEEWLKLFAGDQYPRLCRWVAAAPKTTVGPLACLYLQGPPGCGKSLFFLALEQLWAGPKADYNQVANAKFAEGMRQSPLLVADEGINIKKFSDGVNSPSATFRSLTANFSHTVEEKYKAPTQINAYFRVGITANNSDGLPFRETLAKAGIDAIVERVMWVGVNSSAADYLTNLFRNPAVKESWVQGGVITRHFAWLATMDVPSDGRFLVQGEETEWHQRFVQQQGIKPEVAKVLCALVKNLLRNPSKATRGAYSTEEGVYVLHGKVLDEWPMSSRAPRHSTLLRALDAMAELGTKRRSDDGQRKGNRLFYGVPWSTLFSSGELEDAARDKIEDPRTWVAPAK